MKHNRSMAFLLALLMLSASMTACSETTVAETEGGVAETVAGVEPATVETDAPNERIDSGLGEANFDGHNFNIFVHSAACNDWDAEEFTGETVNDAKYERMVNVSSTYNCQIQDIVQEADNRAGHTKLETAVQAGTNDFDLVTLSAYSSCKALTAGLLVDLNTVGNLDLTQPWWDQRCVEECTFKDATYFMTGDISIGDNNATYCYYFNKNMAENYQLPNMYEMVNEMTWTIDNFKALAEGVSEDTDNDGNHVNDKDDLYGVYIWDDIMMGIVNSAGIKCCTINPEGQLELTLYSEKFVDAFEKFASYAFDQNITCAYQRNGYEADYGLSAFKEDRALFFLAHLGHAVTLREMESDFGILPLPLYDEDQDRYYNSAASWTLSLYCIPRNTYDEAGFARTGHITQALAYESMYTLTPAYYEQTLQGKAARDKESSAMLDLIFESRTYDFGWYFEIGSYNESIMDMLREYSKDVASMYKKGSKLASIFLKRYNEKIQEYMQEGGVG